MVEVLIIEDSADKRNAICAEIRDFFSDDVSIQEATSFAEVAKLIYSQEYDLVVTDLLLPRRPGDQPSDFSEDLVDYVSTSEINSKAVVVAISQYKELVNERVQQFAARGIFLLPYDGSESWRGSLRICMQRVAQRMSYSFVVLCALDKERAAFRDVDGVHFGEYATYHGLDCVELTISGQRGLCIVQPRMGLVDAAAVAARAITIFSPRILAMAGICAGFKDQVGLGSIAVSDVSWDHQAGKWANDGFEISNFQESLDSESRGVIARLLNEDPTLSTYRYRLRELELPAKHSGSIVPSVSGSAVIASEQYSQQIRKAHRKLSALDMEVYGVYRAAALYGGNIRCFAAKAVVDLADEKKDDRLHHDGSLLSARFVSRVIENLL